MCLLLRKTRSGLTAEHRRGAKGAALIRTAAAAAFTFDRFLHPSDGKDFETKSKRHL